MAHLLASSQQWKEGIVKLKVMVAEKWMFKVLTNSASLDEAGLAKKTEKYTWGQSLSCIS